MINGKSAGKSFAYILGVYMGDGCVTKQTHYDGYVFKLNSIDEEFVLETQSRFLELGIENCYVHKYEGIKYTQGFYFGLACVTYDLCEQLKNDTNGKMHIPDYVFDWSKENKLEFIAGIMDSDGFIAQKSLGGTLKTLTNRCYFMGYKSCVPWITAFIDILTSVGVRIGKLQFESKVQREHYKRPYRFGIKIQSWVDAGCYFYIKRKQDRVNLWKTCEPYSERSFRPRKKQKANLNDYTLEAQIEL